MDMIKDYILSGFYFSVVHFPHVVTPFLPDQRRRVFFSTVYVTFLFPTLYVRVSWLDCSRRRFLLQLCRLNYTPRLPIRARRQKETHSFDYKLFQSATSHNSPPSVSIGWYYVKKSQVRHIIYIYIYTSCIP